MQTKAGGRAYTLPVAGGRKKPKHTAVDRTFTRAEEQNLLGAVTIRGQRYSVLIRIQLDLNRQRLMAMLGSAMRQVLLLFSRNQVFTMTDFTCDMQTLCLLTGCKQVLLL